MTHLPIPSAVVFCSDVVKMSNFYEAVAGMTRRSGDATHIVLEVKGFQLVVHALRGEPGLKQMVDSGVQARQDSYVKICLPVESLASARARAAALDGELYPPEQEWQARGFRACDGYDPEGNVFQLREHAA